MPLRGSRVAILAENQYDDLEFWYPFLRLSEESAEVFVVGTGSATTYLSKRGAPVKVDAEAATVDASQFDLVVIPGGFAPDQMRRSAPTVNLVRQAVDQRRLVASIGRGGWMLCSANVIRGKRVTGFKSIKDDLVNAGGIWVDEPCVRDGSIITARTRADLPAFMRTVVGALMDSPLASAPTTR